MKQTVDKAEAEKFLQLIDQIDEFWRANNGPAETRVKKAAAGAR